MQGSETDARFARREGVLEAELGPEETVLLGPDGASYVGLDAVGAVIWAALDRPRSVPALAALLAETHDAPAEVIAADLVPFLDRLVAEGVVDRLPPG